MQRRDKIARGVPGGGQSDRQCRGSSARRRADVRERGASRPRRRRAGRLPAPSGACSTTPRARRSRSAGARHRRRCCSAPRALPTAPGDDRRDRRSREGDGASRRGSSRCACTSAATASGWTLVGLDAVIGATAACTPTRPSTRARSSACSRRSPTCAAARRPASLLLTLMMFLMLSGYYLLKTAREVFILSEGGAEVKSYASAGQAVLLLVPRARLRRVRLARQPHAARHVGVAVLRLQHPRSSAWRRAPACRSASPISSGSASST